MQAEFFLMRVRRLQQFMTTWMFFMLCLTGSTAQAASATVQWQSTLHQQHALTGRIFDTHSGQQISYSYLIDQINLANFILIGEKHDNPDHHQLELLLLQDLLNSKRYQVVLEMLDEQQNQGLEKLQGLPDAATDIRQILDWDTRGWPWSDYGEVVTYSLQQADRLRSGNISRSLLMNIYQDAEHPALTNERFSSMQTITSEQIDIIRQQVFDSHCGSLPMEHTAPMARIQIARDASMAYALNLSAVDNRSAILIAGAFHTRNDFGVPAHLRAMGHQRVVTLQLQEAEGTLQNWQDYLNTTEKPDYIWFTPKFTDKDYCASLRKKAES